MGAAGFGLCEGPEQLSSQERSWGSTRELSGGLVGICFLHLGMGYRLGLVCENVPSCSMTRCALSSMNVRFKNEKQKDKKLVSSQDASQVGGLQRV